MFCCSVLHRLFCCAILLLASAPCFSLAQDAWIYRSGAMLVNEIVTLETDNTYQSLILLRFKSTSYHCRRQCANQSRFSYNIFS